MDNGEMGQIHDEAKLVELDWAKALYRYGMKARNEYGITNFHSCVKPINPDELLSIKHGVIKIYTPVPEKRLDHFTHGVKVSREIPNMLYSMMYKSLESIYNKYLNPRKQEEKKLVVLTESFYTYILF